MENKEGEEVREAQAELLKRACREQTRRHTRATRGEGERDDRDRGAGGLCCWGRREKGKGGGKGGEMSEMAGLTISGIQR